MVKYSSTPVFCKHVRADALRDTGQCKILIRQMDFFSPLFERTDTLAP